MNLKQFLSSKFFLLALPLIIIIFVIISLTQNSPPPIPIILSTTPPESSQQVSIFKPIHITLDTPVDPNLITISSTPSEEWSTTQSNNTITLHSKQYLRVKTNYSISVFYQDKPLVTLTFQTMDQQSDPRYAQEATKELFEKYPLATVFPYETSFLRATYISPLTIEITLKTNSITEQEVISQIKSWITKNGGDSSTHEYQVIPTPTTPPSSPPE